MKQFRRVQDITKLTLRSIDGQVGTIRELYFDDQNWAVRYLSVSGGEDRKMAHGSPCADCADCHRNYR